MNNMIPLASVLDSFFAPSACSPDQCTSRPESDIFESDNNYLVKVDLPGVTKDNLAIELKNETLTVNASTEQSTPEGYRSLRSERQNRIEFSRTFQLGSGIDGQNIEAKFSDGVLTLTIPKSEKSLPKQIEIS
ncbi:Hsp20/alpha crystallin family protein [bacterium]|jgi:HSP20 family protein|nr:Hsp20/alpha crystallin family protein [bacterium]MBT7310166.1 Hsp20/alpha crystallin family protein [bacterium]